MVAVFKGAMTAVLALFIVMVLLSLIATITIDLYEFLTGESWSARVKRIKKEGKR